MASSGTGGVSDIVLLAACYRPSPALLPSLGPGGVEALLNASARRARTRPWRCSRGEYRQELNALRVLEGARDDLTRWLDRFEG